MQNTLFISPKRKGEREPPTNQGHVGKEDETTANRNKWGIETKKLFPIQKEQ